MFLFKLRYTFVVAVILVILLVSVYVSHTLLGHRIKLWNGLFVWKYSAMSSSHHLGRVTNAVSYTSSTTGLSEPVNINIPESPKLLKTPEDPPMNITSNGAFLKSERNLLNMDPPVFLPHFKNPCWYDRSNLTDVQRIQLTKTCFPAVGAKNKTCNELNIKLSKLRCLPYFMLTGMPKSGSTDLYQRIVEHPDVISGRTKGTHWWTRSRGRPITRYLDHFSKLVHALQSPKNDKKATLITGDGSVSTLWDNTWWWNSEYRNDEEPGLLTANFIRHIVPEVKLLVILRNPVDRLYSGYLYFNKKFSAADFHKRVTTELKTFKKCLTEHSIRHCAYKGRPQEVRLNMGLYVLYLKEWMDIFPRDHFLILQFEEYSRQTQETMSTVYKFLTLRDLSHEYGTQSSHANQRKPSARKVGPMLKETRVLLETFYEPYNKALASLMNDTRFLWKTPTRV